MARKQLVAKSRTASKGSLFSTEASLQMFSGPLERMALKTKDPKKLRKLFKWASSRRRFSKDVEDIVARVTEGHAAPLLKRLKRDAPAMRQDRRALLGGFEARLQEAWRKPLELFEMLLVIAAESGELTSDHWPWGESAGADLVFDVTRRLHARGCQVASEILVLLRSGFPSGAHARWRTLHETAVTALFITQHGKELAERFLAHDYVEQYQAAQRYQKYCRKLGYQPYSRKEMRRFAADYRRVVKHYGPSFSGQYGWAADALGRSDSRFGFAQIEAAVKLDHLRPYYQMASHAVHSNPKAILFNLALEPGQDLLLTGPSSLGLSDPGDGAAISLYQLTVALLAMHPSIGSLLVSNTMGLLVHEIGTAFLESERRLKAKRARTRPASNSRSKQQRP